jgi:transposase-like protein
MSSTYKNCPNCGSNKIIKNGFQSGRRVFKCKNCNKKFQPKRQTNKLNLKILNSLTFKKNAT